MLIDNAILARERLLDFRSKDDYYIIKVIVRRKDVIDVPEYEEYHKLFGSHHERFINWYTVRSIDEYDKTVDLIRCICRNSPFRAYICTDVKSHYKSINNLNDYVSAYYKHEASPFDKLIKGNSLQYKKFEDLMKSVASKTESTSNRDRSYILLDIDNKSIDMDHTIKEFCKELNSVYGCRNACLTDNPFRYWYIRYETFNGYHLILPFEIYKRINYQLKKPNSKLDNVATIYFELENHEDVDVKKNAMMLLYANGDNLNL